MQVEMAIAMHLLQEPPTPGLARTLYENFNAVFILIVLLIVVAMMMFIILKRNLSESTVKVMMVGVVIIFVAVFSALTVANDKNAGAVFALLGIVAGYILGKSDKGPSGGGSDEKPPSE